MLFIIGIEARIEDYITEFSRKHTASDDSVGIYLVERGMWFMPRVE